MKQLLPLSVVVLLASPALGLDGPGIPLPGIEERLRWTRYSYEIRSAYPFLKELPEWSKIPTLLEWMNRTDSDAGVEVSYSQLIVLSRADFGHPNHPPAGGLPPETITYHKTERNKAWTRWWESVGQTYGERLRRQGQRNPEAWLLVTRDPIQPLPPYEIAIPDEWVLKTSFRTGDYGGVQTESLTLRRTKEKATLIRGLRKRTGGLLEWEQWQSLTVSQADNFAFAMAYAIDNPWLLKPKDSGKTVPKVEGRNLFLYYPDFGYEFTDLEGNIWWNDNPNHWHGAKPPQDGFVDSSWHLGSVCLLLWRSFPDTSTTNSTPTNSARWNPLRSPDTTVLRQFAEDLELQGEILDTLWHSQRLSDGLEALAEFGTMEQIPAISRLEAELPSKVDKVANLLAKDPNGTFPMRVKEQLLSAAAKAKAAIQKRADGQK